VNGGEVTSGRYDLVTFSKGVVALQTLIVIQNSLINLSTKRRTGYTASDCAKEPAKDSPGNTANSNSYWSSDDTQYCASFGAG